METRYRPRQASAPRSGGNGAAARRPNRIRKKKNPYRAMARRLAVLLGVLILALGVAFAIRFYHSHIPSEKKLQEYLNTGAFLNGIVINGKNVSGMTLDEARGAISPMLEEAAREINLTVSYGASQWLFTAADMGIRTDLEQVLAEAMLFGRGNTGAANKAAKAELEEFGKEYAVTFSADQQALSARIAGIGKLLNTPAIEPSVEPDIWAEAPAFNYSEGTDGRVLNEQALAASINQALAAKDFQALLQPELQPQAPEHNLDWYMANTQLRSTFQTSFGGSSSSRSPNRVGNIQKAATLLNGCKVDVGEEFSFNGYIGPRHEKDGWPLAPGIVNGNTYEMQAGGGICQVTTTLYNALLCSGEQIEITERHHHSWPSAYADTGLDSTVTGSVEEGKSLNFINNTGAPLYIFAYCDQDEYLMTIYIYGEPLPAGVTYDTRGEVIETLEPDETVIEERTDWPLGYEEETISSRKGYKAEAYRDKYVNGVLESSELLYTDRYSAKQGKITRGTGDPSLPKPTASS